MELMINSDIHLFSFSTVKQLEHTLYRKRDIRCDVN